VLTQWRLYQLIEKNINPKLENDISFADLRGKRPFNRIGLVYEKVLKEEPELADDLEVIIDKVLKESYPGLDFSKIKVSNYTSGAGLDWQKLELDMAKEVVKLYTQTEGFQEVFFLNDIKKSYKRVSTDKLIDMLGKEIKIYFKDGLPRWSYNF
jgi:hypothetical protein